MTHTKFYFSPTGKHTQLSQDDEFEINRWAIGDTVDSKASEVNIDADSNIAEVKFEGNLSVGQRKIIIDTVTNNLDLKFEGHEKPSE